MNEFPENLDVAVFCPKCGEKHPTSFINPKANISVVCLSGNCSYNYFPFGRPFEEMEHVEWVEQREANYISD
ncbi:MAG TPA: hypothetical protein VIE65_06125 [Methylobacter sp.]|jgi:hypothetical protein